MILRSLGFVVRAAVDVLEERPRREDAGADIDDAVVGGPERQADAARFAAAVADLHHVLRILVHQQRRIGLQLLGRPQHQVHAGDIDAVHGDQAVAVRQIVNRHGPRDAIVDEDDFARVMVRVHRAQKDIGMDVYHAGDDQGRRDGRKGQAPELLGVGSTTGSKTPRGERGRRRRRRSCSAEPSSGIRRKPATNEPLTQPIVFHA